jgi:uroporphyrinogen decarboxylase
MGFEHFFYSLYDDRALVKEIIAKRTDWFIEICRYAVEMGADFVVMGDDVAYKGKTYVSPADFEELAIPSYRRIAESLDVPLFWHSDGFIEPLIELAIEAGIKGLQCMEPVAGNDLGRIKEKYGDRLVLMGNVSSSEILTQSDRQIVRAEVDRCMQQAKEGGGYMLSSDCSLNAGCTEEAVKEMYQYALKVGKY